MKEGGGGDNLAVAWRKPGDAEPASNAPPIDGEFLSSAQPSGPVQIVMQPVAQTVAEFAPVTFSATATGTPPLTYQWLADNVPIPGANQSTLTIPSVTVPLDGVVYSLVVSNESGTAGSAGAVLTVTHDRVAPSIISVSGGITWVTVTFSEPVSPDTATNAANYRMDKEVKVLNARLRPGGATVVLTTTRQMDRATYRLSVNGVRDASGAGNLVAESTQVEYSAIPEEITIDPESHPVDFLYSANSLSPDWFNSAGRVRTYTWYDENGAPRDSLIRQFVSGDETKYSLRSRFASRDQEVETWIHTGRVFLRLTEEGNGILFEVVNHSPPRMSISLVVGEREGIYYPEQNFGLWHATNLFTLIDGYNSGGENTNTFTFGVSGFEIYAKYGGKEFVRFREYRHMAEGSVAVKAPGNWDYGPRRTTLRFKEPKVLSSDYENRILDMRDFGLKSSHALGSITAGSNLLVLQSEPNPRFEKGDYIIVELGGEAGMGLRGSKGVGGVWPQKSFLNASAMEADRSQPGGTFAWTEDDGLIRRWDGSVWFDSATFVNSVGTTNYFYFGGKAVPLALRGYVEQISEDGLTIRLSATAKQSTTNANVHFDNASVLDRLSGQSPRFGFGGDESGITPTNVTLMIPEGSYALGERLVVNERPGWKIAGAGMEKTRLFSPKGVSSSSIQVIYSPRSIVRDLHLEGNARAHGFGLNFPSIFVEFNGGVTETTLPQGSSLNPGLVFKGSNRSRVQNVRATDIFPGLGASGSTDVWAENCHISLTEGQFAYTQWLFIWADCVGGGATNCSFSSPVLAQGWSFFKSTGTHFLSCQSTNGKMAFNSAGNFLVRDFNFVITPLAQPEHNPWFGREPIANVNNNIGDNAYLAQGGLLENVNMIQQGYVNSDNDIMVGINIGEQNPNVTVSGGSYVAPDYAAPNSGWGAIGINSTGTNTVVDGFRVNGKTRPYHTYANITVADGVVKNSVGDLIYVGLPKAPAVVWENNRPASNRAPRIGAIETKAITELTQAAFTLVADDLNNSANDTLGINQKLSFSLAPGAPSGANLDSDTGLFSWTPTEDQGPGNYSITVNVTDNGMPSLSGTQTFAVLVSEANTAPALAPIPDRTVDEGNIHSFTAVATDSDVPANFLVFSLGPEAPAAATIHPTSGSFTWTPSEAQGPSTNVITVIVADGGTPPLTARRNFQVIVNEVNQAPALDGISDKTASPGSALSFTVSTTDGDFPANVLNYGLEPGSPQGATIDGASGLFSWTPTTAQEGTTNRITVHVTDNGSPPLSDTKSFEVLVPVQAPIEVRLSVSLQSDTSVLLVWTAAPGKIYTLQHSTDLNSWQALTTTNATAASLEHIDAAGPPAHARFYRVVQW